MSSPAVIPAESAPANETVETPEVSVQERLDRATAPELATWRKTGDIPAAKSPKSAESATAQPSEIKETPEIKPKSDASAAPKPSETAAASPAATTQKHTESRSERRYRELSQLNRELRQRLEAIEASRTQPAAETRETPTSQPATAKTETTAKPKPKIDDLDPATGKPKFSTLDQFIDARDEWTREQMLGEVETRLSKAQQERVQTEQQRAQQEQERTLAEGMNKKFDDARKKHSDFDAVALNKDLLIPKGSVADLFFLESEHAGEVLYYLGQHPELLQEFYGDYDLKSGKFTNKVHPMRQHRQLLELERQFASPAPEKTSDSQASASPRPPKLPPPPTEVSGRRAAPPDEAEAALARGDTAGYMRAMNARDQKAGR